ncbi:MAG: esterase-like activity of phytase family protein [Sulfurovum sp.]|nr:esterase-like activity of phytase family protein [Sulfurovum sp.]
MKIALFLVGFMGLLQGGMSNTQITPTLNATQFRGITFLDQKILSYNIIDGLKFSEISDLAYNKTEKKLYLVSDEGKLFVFDALFADKIEILNAVSGVPLVKNSGKKFQRWRRDSEGLTINDKGELYASFEGRAKIGRFDQKGRMVKQYTLPEKLRNPKNYRSRNKSLEALTWHPKYGLLTATEWPLKHKNKKEQTIYGLNGKEWYFKAEAESKSAVVAMEVMDDGDLLVIERSFSGIMNPLVITLKKIYFNGCKKRQMCKSELILKMNTHQGWNIDNFEGLAKVGKHRYVMVSDDNDNFFQKTLLVYFEISH